MGVLTIEEVSYNPQKNLQFADGGEKTSVYIYFSIQIPQSQRFKKNLGEKVYI